MAGLVSRFVIPEIITGCGASFHLPRVCRIYGIDSLFVVTDPGVIETGSVERIVGLLRDAGAKVEVFDGVTPNPRAHEVHAGAEAFLRSNAKGIVAIGGGSPMDCAKGIGIVASNGGSILDYEGVDRISSSPPPMFFLPTTSGSAADVSQFAIITDTGSCRKIAIISKSIIPDVALVDPELTVTMDRDLTVATGMDALCHGIEALVSTGASPLTDLHAREAIRLIIDELPRVIDDLSNSACRERLSRASLLAGFAFSNASLGLVHAMAHALGGVLDSPHGECNAFLLEWVVEYNAAGDPDRFRPLAPLLGLSPDLSPDLLPLRLREAIQRFRHGCGLTGSLASRGVTVEMIPRLAQIASADPCLVTNPRVPSRADIEALYERAL